MTNNKNAIDMKTNYFSLKNASIYSLFGFFALMVTSCGSYKNTSYYDNDGIYGANYSSENVKKEDKTDNSKYKEYFNSLNKENEQEVLADVENDTIKNKTETIIYVYDNSFGYSYWNNNWYGNYWGWNNWAWNSWYGWGWNSWYGPSFYGFYGNPYWCGNGFYNNYYGYNYGNQYAYASNGRRDARFSQGSGRSVTVNRNSNSIGSRDSRNNNSSNPRSYTTTRSTTSSSNTRSNTSSTPVRTYSPSTTTRSQTPRSYTPSTNSSSGSGRSYGGSSSSGSSSGGGRSGGGRR